MYVYLDAHTDETLPCEPELESWAKWLARGGDESWPVDVPEDGATFSASTLTLTDWREYTRSEDGTWATPNGDPKHDFAAIVDGDGYVHWYAEDILSRDNISDAITEWMQHDLDPAHNDSVWVVFGDHNKTPLLATYHADGPRLTLADKPADTDIDRSAGEADSVRTVN
tara:strand:+ start:3068 stop:3574 length:507 start_codon:yes stop_codon:yes gene_type:complete